MLGTFTVKIQIGDPEKRRFVEVEALVDTGATHTMLPRGLLLSLGIQPVEWVSFSLADEQEVQYQVGEAPLRLDGRERTTLVVFGPEDASALLGATTLELFNLSVDPVRRRLVPVPGLLKEMETWTARPTTSWAEVGILPGALLQVFRVH